MSYKMTRTSHTYRPKRSALMRASLITPAHHEAFRQEWEANFNEAMRKCEELQKKGYLVEESLQRGALMESKAKKMAEQLKLLGCEVELIPVAKWAGEKVVFLVYKPGAKPAEAPKPQAPTPAQPSKQITREDIVNAFVKNFTYQSAGTVLTPNVQKFQVEGQMADPRHYAALVDPDAPSSDALVFKVRNARQSTPDAHIINTPKYRNAITRLKAQKKAEFFLFSTSQNKGVRIEYLQKALRSLGDGPLKVYFGGSQLDPIILLRAEPPHLAVVLAPYIDPPQNETITSQEVEQTVPTT